MYAVYKYRLSYGFDEVADSTIAALKEIDTGVVVKFRYMGVTTPYDRVARNDAWLGGDGANEAPARSQYSHSWGKDR